MTPPTALLATRQRASLIAWAKAKAVPVTSCVTARLHPDHLIGNASRAQLAALVIVLAEAADPGKLRAVAETSDDGRPAITDRALMLRRAHTEFRALSRDGAPVPGRLRILEREYQREARRRQVGAERAA
jgi:hypothetical protein